ncbi:MAG: M23 family metallopeptidase [Treponema sp.]|nr:M23 family metallopeptidase [Treponema sp.]MBR5934034.1 M23 family metallopeptidase [Treponema sp.]
MWPKNFVIYAHLESFTVKVGDKVSEGQQIGVMGDTGRGLHEYGQ